MTARPPTTWNAWEFWTHCPDIPILHDGLRFGGKAYKGGMAAGDPPISIEAASRKASELLGREITPEGWRRVKGLCSATIHCYVPEGSVLPEGLTVDPRPAEPCNARVYRDGYSGYCDRPAYDGAKRCGLHLAADRKRQERATLYELQEAQRRAVRDREDAARDAALEAKGRILALLGDDFAKADYLITLGRPGNLQLPAEMLLQIVEGYVVLNEVNS